jgi:murein L,D-transpeptidase YcbB/YkuD
LRRRLGLTSTRSSAQTYDEEVEQAVRDFRQVHGLEPSGAADRTVVDALNRGSAHYERVILLNLDRVRGLPLDEPRYLFVDAAGARLRMIEGGRIVDAMRVIVGQPGMETPDLAGRIRFAIFQPSWNVPPDLVRNSIAPAVLREGIDYLSRRRFALYPDWQAFAPELDPHDVDWETVANGGQQVWVRQRPGGDNMMGAVKFMLPNRHGIYLHDTPHKADFARSDRRLSSGCVRVEDARRLARWLFGSEPPMDWDGAPDQRLDLPAPVAVYISYLTATPEAGEIRFQPDVYRRDQPLLARFST